MANTKTIPNFLGNGDVLIGQTFVGRIDSEGDFRPAIDAVIGEAELRDEIKLQMACDDIGYEWTREQLLFAGIEK